MENFSDTKKAVIYARYSSHSQRDVSIDQQLKACRLFAERQGIEIASVYEDRATTGTNDQRPAFQKMMKDAVKGHWDYVVVYTLDRFSRNRYDSAVNKRTLKSYGIKVLSAMENISDDPTGILMESMLEGLAEYYSAELSEKVLKIMMTIPNIIDPSVPIGKDDSENVEVQRYGEPVVPEFEIPYHTDIMEKFKLRPTELLMIDDMKLGWKMAKDAGVPTAFAGWSKAEFPSLTKEMAELCDHTFYSTDQLYSFLFE